MKLDEQWHKFYFARN